jgi:uncharacterized membrane protein
MPSVGVAEVLVWLLSLAAYVAAGIRIAGLRRDSPLKTLQKRFARGEIGQAEFDTARRILGE